MKQLITKLALAALWLTFQINLFGEPKDAYYTGVFWTSAGLAAGSAWECAHKLRKAYDWNRVYNYNIQRSDFRWYPTRAAGIAAAMRHKRMGLACSVGSAAAFAALGATSWYINRRALDRIRPYELHVAGKVITV